MGESYIFGTGCRTRWRSSTRAISARLPCFPCRQNALRFGLVFSVFIASLGPPLHRLRIGQLLADGQCHCNSLRRSDHLRDATPLPDAALSCLCVSVPCLAFADRRFDLPLPRSSGPGRAFALQCEPTVRHAFADLGHATLCRRLASLRVASPSLFKALARYAFASSRQISTVNLPFPEFLH